MDSSFKPWTIFASILVAIAALICAMALFGRGQDDSTYLAPTPAAPITTAPAPRFDPDAVAEMKRRLHNEPEISDVLTSDSPLEVEWQVGIVGLPDDTRIGALDYARILCRRLRDAGLVDADTDLRLVDVIKLQSKPGNFRAAALAHANCTTGESMGI